MDKFKSADNTNIKICVQTFFAHISFTSSSNEQQEYLWIESLNRKPECPLEFSNFVIIFKMIKKRTPFPMRCQRTICLKDFIWLIVFLNGSNKIFIKMKRRRWQWADNQRHGLWAMEKTRSEWFFVHKKNTQARSPFHPLTIFNFSRYRLLVPSAIAECSRHLC